MRRLWLLLAQHYVRRSAWTGCDQQTLTWVVTYNAFREQIEALIAMSDVCEQEIKFEVFSWNVLIEYIEHNISVQVGPFEKCCIWGQIWMVDQPTRWEKGDNFLQNNFRISHLRYYYIFSITLTELMRRAKFVTSITMQGLATVIWGKPWEILDVFVSIIFIFVSSLVPLWNLDTGRITNKVRWY